MLVYYGFNITQPPFDNPKVRQAFKAALDTEPLTKIYSASTFYNNEVASRTIIPAQSLSLDLTGVVGLPYDPTLAKQLLAEGGFSDPKTFPETKMLIVYFPNAPYPGIIVKAANEAARMWKENLGVTVTLDIVALQVGGSEQLDLIKSGKYQIFEHGVWVGLNDPNDFIYSMFYPFGGNNLTGFNNDDVTLLINTAASEGAPALRLPMYLELERIISEQEVPVIPIMHCTVDGSKW
jgi:oligopeptide transport system substrate-binding protein